MNLYNSNMFKNSQKATITRTTQATEQKLLHDLGKLIELGEAVVASGKWNNYGFSYDRSLAFRWKASCTSFFSRTFGETNHYNRMFEEAFQNFGTAYGKNLLPSQGVLLGARDDIESGALTNIKTFVQAEIFSDLLEQAEHLQQHGYSLAAAVIAGAVLEDGLRRLCSLREFELNQRPTLGPMNDALARAGVYSSLVQKQITALADLRNKAAHGKNNEFGSNDVELMLSQVRDILSKYLG